MTTTLPAAPTLAPAPERRPDPRRLRPLLARLLVEVALVATLYVLYNVGRVLAARRTTGAFAHAQELLHVEHWLRLPGEQSLQGALLPFQALIRLANGYYASVHFPLTFGVLVWLFVRHPDTYLWTRRSLVAATAAGLAIEILLPVAPPRMLSQVGFVDTGKLLGQSTYGSVRGDRLANQFAAMPSLHVGWAVVVATACIAAGTSRWRWLWIAHPVVTLVVVVVTGNHYWLDAAAGSLLVVGAMLALHPHHGPPTPVPAQLPRRRQPWRCPA